MSRSSRRSQRSSPGLALLSVLGRLVGRRLEMRVAEAAAPAAPDDRGLAGHHEVGEEGVGVIVVDGRAGRHVEVEVLAGGTVAARSLAATARGRPEVVLVAEVPERRLAGVDPEVDRAAATAVAAVRAAARDVRLLAKRRGPVTARARTYPDLDAVEKHRPDCRMGSATRPPCGIRASRVGRRTVRRPARGRRAD